MCSSKSVIVKSVINKSVIIVSCSSSTIIYAIYFVSFLYNSILTYRCAEGIAGNSYDSANTVFEQSTCNNSSGNESQKHVRVH